MFMMPKLLRRCIVGFGVVGLASGVRAAPAAALAVSNDNPYVVMSLFAKVMETVRQHYVDPSQTDYRTMVTRALQGMVSSLDEFSEFLTPDDLKVMEEETEGRFGGIGVVVGVREGAIVVIAPMDDSPGQRAGLMPGDRLVEVDGHRTDQMSLQEVVRLMRGAPGTRVRLRIAREGSPELREVEIERADIHVDSVRDVRVMEGNIGYIRISQFDERTAELLDDALHELVRTNVVGLVLDLRSNPGGLLAAAVDVCARFLPRGTLVLTTEGRPSVPKQTFLTHGTPRIVQLPMVVLINEGSASAAEVVAGCLQDHGRAVLVGERSFGKGSVQTIIPLEDGYALRLTTARYFTPKRRMIHELGIEPDIRVPAPLREFEASPGAGGRRVDSRDVQLQRAVEVLRGVLAYGARSGARPK